MNEVFWPVKEETIYSKLTIISLHKRVVTLSSDDTQTPSHYLGNPQLNSL